MTSIPSEHFAVGIGSADAPNTLALFKQPTPRPERDELLIRNHFAAVTPLDRWHLDFGLGVDQYPFVLGDSFYSTVVAVGEGIEEFQVGDEVFGFQHNPNRAMAYQEYQIASKYNAGKVPKGLDGKLASAVSNNGVTAFWSLFGEPNLNLPYPSKFPLAPSKTPEHHQPVFIWGGGTSAGQYAIQVLRLAGYSNILVAASKKHTQFLMDLGAKEVFDYSEPDVTDKVLEFVKLSNNNGGHQTLPYVLDCVGDEELTIRPIRNLVGPGSTLAILLPVIQTNQTSNGQTEQKTVWTLKEPFPENVKISMVRTHFYQDNHHFKDVLQPKLIPELLVSGGLTPNRVRVVKGKTLLDRVGEALHLIRTKQVSGEKIVLAIQPAV